MMNPPGFSPSSFFSEDILFSDERQVALETESITGYSGMKLDGALRMEGTTPAAHQGRIQLDSKMGKCLAPPDCYVFHGRNVNLPFGKHIIGAERMASRSLPSAIEQDLCPQTNSNAEHVPSIFDGDKRNLMGSQYENGLFSSSLSDLFSRNLKLSSNHSAYSHSVAAAAAVVSHYREEEDFESTEEVEAQTIGNLLPDDDDLLSGVTDGFDTIARHNNGDEMEELDLFSSVGGLELGEDGFSQRNLDLSDLKFNNQLTILSGIAGEHPLGEHPSRTLFVRNINSNVEDFELSALFGQYGDIRALYTACKHRGFVMISYYDIRAACNAMKSLQNKSLRRRKLDIHFSIPKENPSEKDVNQGTLSVFNLDSSVSNDELREIFGVYGEVKEIRESPGGSHHKYVEFYDVRSAESALRALNRNDIGGKQINLEPGRPGGSKRFFQPFLSELEQEDFGVQLQQHGTSMNFSSGFPGSLSLGGTGSRADNGIILGSHSMNEGSIGSFVDHVFHSGVSSSVSNSIPSLRVEPGNQSSITDSGHLHNHLKFELHGTSNLHSHSLPEYRDALSNGLPFGSPGNINASFNSRPPEIVDGQQLHRVGSNGKPLELNEVFGSCANGSCPPPGRHYMWNNSRQCHPQSPAILWPSSPSFVNGIGPAHPQHLHAVPRASSHMLNSVLPLNNHHVGSAPSVNPSLWDRHHAYAGESPDTAVFHPGSLGSMRISGNSPHPLEFVPHNMFPHSGGNCLDLPMPIPSKNVGLHPHHQRCMIFPGRGQLLPMMASFDTPNERNRNRRNEGNLSQGENKKQFELDLDRILRGDDKRTTLMIKNIPNKYTSKMLLAAIDERHKGTYDFIYLPIDFKNKCNVGYAFINMTDPALIVPFYQTFNGKKWEKFNSEKVASLAYARIQGKAALIAHFQNSSLMNEDKRCRPILFHTDGPNAGDQVPFPMGANIRARPGKHRNNFFEENTQESSPSSVACEDFSNGDSSSGSGKESD